MIGVKGRFDFGDKREWYVPYYADVGTGQSDLTLQVFGGIGYRFNAWGSVLALPPLQVQVEFTHRQHRLQRPHDRRHVQLVAGEATQRVLQLVERAPISPATPSAA